MSVQTILRSLFIWATVFLILALAPVMRGDGDVVNGGFETGNFSGWTVNDPSGFTNIGSNPAFAHSGTFHANLGANGLLGSLSQNLATTVGMSYNLSFWLANDSGFPPNEFDVFWNGAPIFTSTDSAGSPYTNFTFSNLIATGSSTLLEFRYRNDDDFFRLDDVVSTSVPEPRPTLLLGLSAFGLLAFAEYRAIRRRNAVSA